MSLKYQAFESKFLLMEDMKKFVTDLDAKCSVVTPVKTVELVGDTLKLVGTYLFIGGKCMSGVGMEMVLLD